MIEFNWEIKDTVPNESKFFSFVSQEGKKPKQPLVFLSGIPSWRIEGVLIPEDKKIDTFLQNE